MAAPSVNPSACAADDLQCSARAFTAAARRAKSDAERVEYLYFASRAYLALSEKPPQSPASSRDLCQAKQLIDQAVALPATELRERVTRSRKETRTRLKTENISCQRPKPRAKDQARVAVAGPQGMLEKPMTPSAPSATAPPSNAAPAPDAAPDAPAPLLTEVPRATTAPPEVEASERTRGVASGMLAPPTSTTTADLRAPQIRVSRPLRDVPATPPPGRRLLISGGVALAAGLSLTGFAAASGARALAARRTGFTSTELAASPDNRTRDAALRADYQRHSTTAIAIGITGGAALVAGIVMLCVGARRKERDADREPLLMPIRAGMLFSAKF